MADKLAQAMLTASVAMIFLGVLNSTAAGKRFIGGGGL